MDDFKLRVDPCSQISGNGEECENNISFYFSQLHNMLSMHNLCQFCILNTFDICPFQIIPQCDSDCLFSFSLYFLGNPSV